MRAAAGKTVLWVGLLALSGCGPADIWYKAGVSSTRLNNDLTNCQVSAAQKVPVNTQIETTPIYTTPISTTCGPDGCTTTGGEVSGGEVYSFDSNEKLRSRVTAQCMGALGYEMVSLPRCRPKDKKGGLPRQSVLPGLGPNACATSDRSGRWYIINRP